MDMRGMDHRGEEYHDRGSIVWDCSGPHLCRKRTGFKHTWILILLRQEGSRFRALLAECLR